MIIRGTRGGSVELDAERSEELAKFLLAALGPHTRHFDTYAITVDGTTVKMDVDDALLLVGAIGRVDEFQARGFV